MMEAPDPKAEFAVNLPRTEAQRNRRKSAHAARDRMEMASEIPGEICYEQPLSLRKDFSMQETAACDGRLP
jgi:hypothetical protein